MILQIALGNINFQLIHIIKLGSLKGKVVWITGASSGIGRALAIKLAENNVKLCISARSADRLEEVKVECLKVGKKLQPNDVLVVKMDMLDIELHQYHFDTVVKHFGEIDVLVNNAGRSQRALFRDTDISVDRELFELDVFTVINLTRLFVKHFDGRGHVLVTSSSLGLTSVPNSASYTAAKHALHVRKYLLTYSMVKKRNEQKQQTPFNILGLLRNIEIGRA